MERIFINNSYLERKSWLFDSGKPKKKRIANKNFFAENDIGILVNRREE